MIMEAIARELAWVGMLLFGARSFLSFVSRLLFWEGLRKSGGREREEGGFRGVAMDGVVSGEEMKGFLGDVGDERERERETERKVKD